jgi:hypothetical protein
LKGWYQREAQRLCFQTSYEAPCIYRKSEGNFGKKELGSGLSFVENKFVNEVFRGEFFPMAKPSFPKFASIFLEIQVPTYKA